jgi:DNA-binding XRE family transcriptional regulator
MRSFEAFKKKMLKNPAVKAEYDRLEPEFALARALIGARAKAKLTQEEVARRMGTSQSAVARMESGRALPSTASLVKYAHAVGKKLQIALS